MVKTLSQLKHEIKSSRTKPSIYQLADCSDFKEPAQVTENSWSVLGNVLSCSLINAFQKNNKEKKKN